MTTQTTGHDGHNDVHEAGFASADLDHGPSGLDETDTAFDGPTTDNVVWQELPDTTVADFVLKLDADVIGVACDGITRHEGDSVTVEGLRFSRHGDQQDWHICAAVMIIGDQRPEVTNARPSDEDDVMYADVTFASPTVFLPLGREGHVVVSERDRDAIYRGAIAARDRALDDNPLGVGTDELATLVRKSFVSVEDGDRAAILNYLACHGSPLDTERRYLELEEHTDRATALRIRALRRETGFWERIDLALELDKSRDAANIIDNNDDDDGIGGFLAELAKESIGGELGDSLARLVSGPTADDVDAYYGNINHDTVGTLIHDDEISYTTAIGIARDLGTYDNVQRARRWIRALEHELGDGMIMHLTMLHGTTSEDELAKSAISYLAYVESNAPVNILYPTGWNGMETEERERYLNGVKALIKAEKKRQG